jgi:hypothetical protein
LPWPLCGFTWVSFASRVALPFRRLWHSEPNAASDEIDYANFYSRSHDAVIRVYDETGNVIGTHEHAGEFREP